MAGPKSAGSILFEGTRQSILTAMGVFAAIITTPFLIGFPLFGLIAKRQLDVHFTIATGVTPRRSWLPFVVATLTYGGAIAVMLAWMNFVQYAHRGPRYDLAMVAPAQFALMTSPVIYALAAWVLAPFLFLAVAAIDPKAPRKKRQLFTLALRLTSEVPVKDRVLAIVLSGALLLGPAVVGATAETSNFRALAWLACLGSAVIFLPIASSLLVANYARARDGIDGFHSELPTLPPGLLVYTIIGFVASIAAAVTSRHWYHDDVAMLLVALAGSWFFVTLAFLAFWRAHRLRTLDVMREDAPPGRYALELTRQRGASDDWRLSAGPLSFRVPPDAVPQSTSGDTFTLVGDFKPSATSFRESAVQPWPAHATLHVGTCADVVKKSIERAAWLAYVAVSLTGVISAWLIFVENA